jgi:hypothetical protein
MQLVDAYPIEINVRSLNEAERFYKIHHVAVKKDELVMGILTMNDFVGYYTNKLGKK